MPLCARERTTHMYNTTTTKTKGTWKNISMYVRTCMHVTTSLPPLPLLPYPAKRDMSKRNMWKRDSMSAKVTEMNGKVTEMSAKVTECARAACLLV